MRTLFVGLILTVGCSLCAYAQDQALPADAQNALDHFSKAAFRANMRFLSDDLLEGRGTATRGQELAAKYVAAQFEAFGLEPAGTKGTFFQQVPFRKITVDPKACEFSITRNGKTSKLTWAEDFLMRGNELKPDVVVEAPAVFVGYGVVDPGRKYDDYAGLDVKGKIVVQLPGAPADFPANERAHYASGVEKARVAAAHGAVGIIRLWTPESDKLLPWSRIPNQVESPAFRWLDPQGMPNDSYPEIKTSALTSLAQSEKLFEGAKESWAEMLKKAADSTVHGFPLTGTIRMHAVSKNEDVTSPNVVGLLKGSDATLAREYVVYSAHTDHMGIGSANQR